MKKNVLVVVLSIMVIITLVISVTKSGIITTATDADMYTINEKNVEKIIKSQEDIDKYTRNIQKSPEQTVKLNALIRKMMYSNDDKNAKLDDGDFKALMNMQRMLFAPELLEKNPASMHLLRLENEVDRWHDAETSIIQFQTNPPRKIGDIDYYGIKKESVFVDMVYYTNKANVDIYVTYVLYLDEDGRWKIFGWEKCDEFILEK